MIDKDLILHNVAIVGAGTTHGAFISFGSQNLVSPVYMVDVPAVVNAADSLTVSIEESADGVNVKDSAVMEADERLRAVFHHLESE